MSLRAAAALEIEFLSQLSRLSSICSEHGAVLARGNESLFGIGRLPYNHLGYYAVIALDGDADSSTSCFFPTIETARAAARAIAGEAECAVALHLGPNTGVFERVWSEDGSTIISEAWTIIAHGKEARTIEIPVEDHELTLAETAGSVFAEEAERLEQNQYAAAKRAAEAELHAIVDRWAEIYHVREVSSQSLFDYLPAGTITVEVNLRRIRNECRVQIKRAFRMGTVEWERRLESLKAIAEVEGLSFDYSIVNG